MKALFLATAIVALVLGAAPSTPASASSPGARMPQRVVVDGAPLYLNGAGVHAVSFLKVDVYVAALYLPWRTASAERILRSTEPKQLALLFKRSVSRDELMRAASRGLRSQSGSADLEPRLAQLAGALTDIAKGDVLTFTYREDGVEIGLNGGVRGRIEDPGFAIALLSAWLGPNPVSSSLKERLLGRR